MTQFLKHTDLTPRDYELLRRTQSTVCHCPTSNLFLGSGLFNMGEAVAQDVEFGVGTDGGSACALLTSEVEVTITCSRSGYQF